MQPTKIWESLTDWAITLFGHRQWNEIIGMPIKTTLYLGHATVAEWM